MISGKRHAGPRGYSASWMDARHGSTAASVSVAETKAYLCHLSVLAGLQSLVSCPLMTPW